MPLDLSHVAASREITDDEVVRAFADIMAAMLRRGIIRTKNVVGDLGEQYVARAYADHGPRGALTLQPTNSTDVDALDTGGARYAIKAASPDSTRTSAFHLASDHSAADAAFDYLVVVRLDDHLRPQHVVEFTWAQFFELKKWNGRQKAWFLPLTRTVLATATAVCPRR